MVYVSKNNFVNICILGNSWNGELHLVAIAAQVQKWKPNNMNSICWGFFAINDNSLVDLKNP
jgi:hypothetical protein